MSPLLGQAALYVFEGNTSARVYVNGELAFETSYASAGKGLGDLAGAPFSFDAAKGLEPGAANRIAVRVMRATGLGGGSFAAMLIGTYEACSADRRDAYRFWDQALPPQRKGVHH